MEQAHQWYLMGLSLRDISQRSGMGENGYVQIHRWAMKYGWKAEREEQETQVRQGRKATYLSRVSAIQDAHLALAEKVRYIALLALEGYVEHDEAGNITGIKPNPRTGLPAISPFAIQQMIVGAAELERKALGFELLPQGDMEEATAQTTVDAGPSPQELELRRRFGDFLAQQTLVETVESLPLPEPPEDHLKGQDGEEAHQPARDE